MNFRISNQTKVLLYYVHLCSMQLYVQCATAGKMLCRISKTKTFFFAIKKIFYRENATKRKLEGKIVCFLCETKLKKKINPKTLQITSSGIAKFVEKNKMLCDILISC